MLYTRARSDPGGGGNEPGGGKVLFFLGGSEGLRESVRQKGLKGAM